MYGIRQNSDGKLEMTATNENIKFIEAGDNYVVVEDEHNYTYTFFPDYLTKQDIAYYGYGLSLKDRQPGGVNYRLNTNSGYGCQILIKNVNEVKEKIKRMSFIDIEEELVEKFMSALLTVQIK